MKISISEITTILQLPTSILCKKWLNDMKIPNRRNSYKIYQLPKGHNSQVQLQYKTKGNILFYNLVISKKKNHQGNNLFPPDYEFVLVDNDLEKSYFRPYQPEGTETINYSISDFEIDIKSLASKIIKSKTKYDSLIAITRGGMVPTGYLCQALSIKKIYVCGGYFDRDGNFEFTNYPQRIEGKALMISDLCKTGNTLLKIKEGYLQRSTIKTSIDIACLHYFSNSIEVSASEKINIRPKFFVHEYTEPKFIRYPWEC